MGMRQIQESAAGKLAAVVLLVISLFAGAGFGLNLIQGYPYLDVERYQDSPVFYELIERKLYAVSELFELQERLKEDSLDYVSRRQMENRVAQIRESFADTQTNLRVAVRDESGKIVSDLTYREEQHSGPVVYASFVLGEYDVVMHNGGVYAELEGEYGSAPIYTIECTVVGEEQLSQGVVQDEFYRLWEQYNRANTHFAYWTDMLLTCLVVAGVCVLYILWTAGHKAEQEGIVLTWQEKIYLEVYLAAAGMAWYLLLFLFIVFFLSGSMWWDLNEYLVNSLRYADEILLLYRVVFCGVWVAFAGVGVLLLRTLVVRLKAHALRKTTLVCKLAEWSWGAGKKLFGAMPVLWRTIALFAAYGICCSVLLNIARYDGWAAALLLVVNFGVLGLLCWWSLGFQRLREGSRAIAAGNLNHQIATQHMPPELKEHAEDLNNLSVGLQQAVEQQMKSERFKAELITNVSHDLKTPLTSIINYVDLLKSTRQTDPKAVEYIGVLDRKSQRLKKLTEDLVEASKASTGTLKVNREKLSMDQLIDQALGEYTEKLERRGLKVILRMPEEETWVCADGRHLWRVMDNLLSNCCKYALENTRVYLELVRGKGQVTLSVKNVSREPLNIPAEQLMERFVRGEASRTTEGSGLGLSIARSLTELQGGTFDVDVDGDLFKVMVTVPQGA